MSSISFYLRTPNSKGLCPVTVRHTHKGSDFAKASGYSVLPAFFDHATGTVSNKHPDYANLNAGIRRVVNRMETAANNCQRRGVEPVKAQMESQYKLLQQAGEVFAERDRLTREIGTPIVMLPDLRKRLAAAQLEVAQLTALIAQLDPSTDTGNRLTTYFDTFLEERTRTLAAGSKNNFTYTKSLVERFRPTWEITDVNTESLRAFEQWLLEKGAATNTIINSISQIKTVCYRYGRKLNVDLNELRQHRRDTKSVKANKNGVVFLEKEEVDSLLALPLKGERAKTRDQFVFLCLTGLRHGDSLLLTRDHINKKQQLVLSADKTDTDIVVPLSDKALDLLVRNNFDFKRRMVDKQGIERAVKNAEVTSNFNKIVQRLCKKIPSLSDTVETKKQRGGKTTKKMQPRYKAITSHVGRKTLVNNSLQLGISPVAIASIVGHKGTKLIMDTYGSGSAGIDRIKEL